MSRNARTLRARIAAFGLLAASAVPCVAQLNMAAETERIKGAYPDGSVYLTYTALNNFYQHLSQHEKRSGIEKTGVEAQAIATFLAFLRGTAQASLNPSTATAFLRLDVANGVAYTKAASDLDGASRPLVTWTREDVRTIAYLCDQMFKGHREVDVAIRKVRERKVGVARGWAELDALAQNPFVRSDGLATLVQENRKLQKVRSAEIQQLKTRDPAKHAEIMAFIAQYDEGDAGRSPALAAEPVWWSDAGEVSAIRAALHSFYTAKKLPVPASSFDEGTFAFDAGSLYGKSISPAEYTWDKKKLGTRPKVEKWGKQITLPDGNKWLSGEGMSGGGLSGKK